MIDSNDLYVYSCLEAAGSTTLANSGFGINGTLNVAGGANTPKFDSGRLTRGSKSIFWTAGANNQGAYSANTADVSGTGVTLEAFVRCEGLPQIVVMPLSISLNNNSIFIAGHSTNNTWYAGVQIGLQRNTFNFPVAIRYGVPTYLAVVYDQTDIRLYVDGMLRATETAVLGMVSFNQIALANYCPGTAEGTQFAFQGAITQARVSNVARSAAYISDNADTIFRM